MAIKAGCVRMWMRTPDDKSRPASVIYDSPGRSRITRRPPVDYSLYRFIKYRMVYAYIIRKNINLTPLNGQIIYFLDVTNFKVISSFNTFYFLLLYFRQNTFSILKILRTRIILKVACNFYFQTVVALNISIWA